MEGDIKKSLKWRIFMNKAVTIIHHSLKEIELIQRENTLIFLTILADINSYLKSKHIISQKTIHTDLSFAVHAAFNGMTSALF